MLWLASVYCGYFICFFLLGALCLRLNERYAMRREQGLPASPPRHLNRAFWYLYCKPFIFMTWDIWVTQRCWRKGHQWEERMMLLFLERFERCAHCHKVREKPSERRGRVGADMVPLDAGQ